MTTGSGAPSPPRWKPARRRLPANQSSATTVCGRDLLHEAGITTSEGRCGPNSRPAGGCAIEAVLLAPFRSGAAHIVILGPVFAGRPVQGRNEKRQQRGGGAAEQAKDGYAHRECSAGRELRATRLPRVPTSRCIRRVFES